MYEDLETIKNIFDSYKIKIIIGYGLLLGMYRDKKPLPGDDDVDICIMDKVDLKTRKEIGWLLYDCGFEPQPISFNVFGRMEPAEYGYNGDEETGIIVCERNFKFTIFFFKEEMCDIHGREYVCVPKLGAKKLMAIPIRFFHNLEEIKINRKKYFTPSPIGEYLSFVYFDNWKDKKDRRHGLTYDKQHEDTRNK